MLLDYVPQHRDDAEAASARFPGDTPGSPAAGASIRSGALGWACAALGAAAVLLVVQRGRVGSVVWGALVQADRIDHPIFVGGVLLTAIGGAMVIVPLVYLLGLRRSARASTDQRVRVDLDDEFLTARLPGKELVVDWRGVVAVAETRRLFVLKTAGDLCIVLPKQAAPGFDDSPGPAVEALRDLLRRRTAPFAHVAHATSLKMAA